MAEWLILRMPRAADAAASWLTADSDGRPLAAVESGPIEAASSAALNRRVAVLVPAAEVLCLDVELPAGSGARASRLVAFALEEQLASDVETQHFAIGRSSVPGRTAVAVVARSLLGEWLAKLGAAGIKPELLCTDAALMPRLPGHALALMENDTLIFTDAEDDAQLTLSAGPGGFASALAIAFGEELAATHLLFHANPVDWQRRSSEIEAARSSLASLKVQLLATGALPWLASQLPYAKPINLLQGEYAPRTSFGGGDWTRWRLAAVLAAVVLFLHVGVQCYSLWKLNRNDKELDQAILAIAGPGLVNGEGSIRKSLEPRLLAAQSQNGGSGLLAALQVLAHAMTGVPGARVRAFNYKDGALQLKLRASDAQSLDRINQSLRAAGWQAELISGGADGDAFEGNVQLRGGAS
jgi:general secretion pathway protein L